MSTTIHRPRKGYEYRHGMTDRATSSTGRFAMRLKARSTRFLDNYGLVLLLLVVSFMLFTAGNQEESRVALITTLSLAVLATWMASSVTPRTMAITSVLVVGSGLVALVAALTVDRLVSPWVLAPLALSIVSAPTVILQRILSHRTVTAQTIIGAICVYVYIGLIFALVYGLVDAIGTDPFFAQGPTQRPGQYTYFSFVTMSTLGYGDLSPGTDLGQGLAVLEALVGSIYLVTLVARLVAMFGRQPGEPHKLRTEKRESR
jgi:hypothetical protein